jgi:hypothetical protein
MPQYMLDKIGEYVASGRCPGAFLAAVLADDLQQAERVGSTTDLHQLEKLRTFLHNSVPNGCWGSPTKVANWTKLRGLEGVRLELLG